jgi:superfamily I DNA/RNA helicase
MGSDKGEAIFWEALDEWRNVIEKKKAEAYDIRGRVYDLLDRCDIRIAPDDPNLMVGLGIASQIIRSVEEIHRRRIAGQARRTPRGVVSEVYHALVRRQRDFGESIPSEDVGDGILITTGHQANGLEWPVVIIPMLATRRFPVNPSPHGTSFPDEIAARYGTSLEDERRLFYVANTRAKERLFLLDPASVDARRRSVFLTNLATDGVLKPTHIDAIPASVWHISKKDMEPGGVAPLSIGLSDLLLYVECPFQFGLRAHSATARARKAME